MSASISHTGTVTAVSGDMVSVRLDKSESECTGCAVAALCHRPDILDIPVRGASPSMVGRQVRLEASSSSQTLSVVMLLAVPLVILVGALLAALSCGLGEGASTLVSLGATALWYVVVYAMRGSLRRKTEFRIVLSGKQDNQ